MRRCCPAIIRLSQSPRNGRIRCAEGLALRARGLGTAWTTLHLQYEREIAELLGLPAGVRQGVLLPVAYSKGTDFKPGPRADLDATMHVNGW